jgi:hypothetical protein
LMLKQLPNPELANKWQRGRRNAYKVQ